MKILNFGSLNIDYVYSVDHIVAPGETISSTQLNVYPGGKGLNQSVALARGGAAVFHAGMLGEDGGMLRKTCEENHVDFSLIRTVEERSGNAIIQVSGKGQNSIVLFGGANRRNEKAYVDEVLSHFGAGDLLLLQNEINLLDYLIERAAQRKMKIALNPSPYDDAVKRCDLHKVHWLVMNEVEGSQITGERDPDAVLEQIQKRYPQVHTVLTLGKAGAVYQAGRQRFYHGIYNVPVVDTTAAGDTFTGYFFSGVARGDSPQECLRLASIASSLAVSRKGAIPSIPWREKVLSAKLSCIT